MTKLQKPVSKFINNYKSELSRTFLDLDTKKIGKIIELIRYTILKKKKFLHVAMVDQLLLVIIFYAILIKE